MNLQNAQEMVAEFHQHIGAQVASKPQLLRCNRHAARWLALQIEGLAKIAAEGADGTTDLLLSRTALMLEEISEWLNAHADKDLVAAADAIADRAYVLIGDAVAAGIPLAKLFNVIHHSNMSKIYRVTTGNGKAAKGVDYFRPEIAEILHNSLAMSD